MKQKLIELARILKKKPEIKERLERLTFGCYFITEENRKIQIHFQTLLNEYDILEIGIKEIIGHEPAYHDVLEYLGEDYYLCGTNIHKQKLTLHGNVNMTKVKLSLGPLSDQSDETLTQIISLCKNVGEGARY